MGKGRPGRSRPGRAAQLKRGEIPGSDASPGDVTKQEQVMREYVWLECSECKDRNYRVQKETRGADRLELKKYCRRERKHTVHKESRKK
jgi:large subunit ribosomal protein L33